MAHTRLTVALMVLALAALAGCVEETGTASTAAAPLRTASASDEAACLAAVAAQTNNSVMVLESLTSEANNMVTVGVGPDRAPWQCLINGGVVAQVMSMTNEGTL